MEDGKTGVSGDATEVGMQRLSQSRQGGGLKKPNRERGDVEFVGSISSLNIQLIR